MRTVKIVEAWNLAIGIVAEIENPQDGLPKGTVIRSDDNMDCWIVESRVIASLSIDQVKRYPIESESIIHLSFKSNELREETLLNIIGKSNANIFQYQLRPIDMAGKPTIGNYVIVE